MRYFVSITLLLPLLWICINPTQAQPQANIKKPPIIDMHLHAFTATSQPNPVTGKPSACTSDNALLQATLAAMERYNIVKAVVSGPLNLVKQWRDAAPNRFLCAPAYPLYNENINVDFLRAEYLAGRLGAFGEVLAQLAGLSPSDPWLEPYLKLCEELDVPVGIHTGMPPPGITYSSCPKNRARLGNPLLVEEALVRHPKLRVYIMHAGYPFLEDTIALMHAHPQVFADLAWINWHLPQKEFHEYLRRLIQAGFGKRLMFGSDQIRWPETIGMAVKAIESAPFLTNEQKRDIFYNNAARFLRLDEDARERLAGLKSN